MVQPREYLAYLVDWTIGSNRGLAGLFPAAGAIIVASFPFRHSSRGRISQDGGSAVALSG